MNKPDFIVQLTAMLASSALVDFRQNPLLGYPRASVDEAREMSPPPKESAVMMLLFQRNNDWHMLLILRPEGQGVHSNQMAFPGGRLEWGETSLDAALRETFEEVGVKPGHIHVLGKLTELFIPPSHFIVQPFVGFIDDEPEFICNDAEVASIIEVPIQNFLRENIIEEKEIFLPTHNRHIKAKYFDVEGNTLWGATAMMIQEFRMLFGFKD